MMKESGRGEFNFVIIILISKMMLDMYIQVNIFKQKIYLVKDGYFKMSSFLKKTNNMCIWFNLT